MESSTIKQVTIIMKSLMFVKKKSESQQHLQEQVYDFLWSILNV